MQKGIFFLIASTISFNALSQDSILPKKIIKFGWDYADVNKLLIEGEQIQQKQPFDGIVFPINKNIMQAFDTALLPESYFRFEDLKKLKWTNFTDNFLWLRGYGSTGPNWYNDSVWKNISANLSNLSKAVTASKSVGILFDPEYYLHDKPNLDPWVYDEKLYPGKTFNDVKEQVRKRGMQVMEALQSDKYDIKVLSVWMLGLAIDQLNYKPIEKTMHALLPAFFEGMLLAKNLNAEIIDGNETAYWYRNASDFLLSKKMLFEKGQPLLSPEVEALYKSTSIAQPVFVDGLLGNTPEYNKRRFDTLQKVNWLKNCLMYSLATSDEYVWIYSQRIKWDADTSIINLLKNAKQEVNQPDIPACYRKNFTNNDLVNQQSAQSDNRLSFYPSTKTLSLKIASAPFCISIFEDNRIIYIEDSIRAKKKDIALGDRYSGKGTLSVMISYKKAFLGTVTETAIIK